MLFDVPEWNLGAPKKVEIVQADKKPKSNSISKDHMKIGASLNTNSQEKSHHSKVIKSAEPARFTKTSISKDQTHSPASSGSKLQRKMEEKLAAARFRFLNQKLYESNSKDAFNHFKEHPDDFVKYHEGFRLQVNQWPVNPVDVFVGQLEEELKRRKHGSEVLSVADLGCGDAKISKVFSKSSDRIAVSSFDLAASCPEVTVCDVSSHIPLPDASMDVVIFSLSLMNTNFLDALREAKRILKPVRGVLRIAEVESRFEGGPDAFISAVEGLGFEKRRFDSTHKVFLLFEFRCTSTTTTTKATTATKDTADLLKPCLYKKR